MIHIENYINKVRINLPCMFTVVQYVQMHLEVKVYSFVMWQE